MAAESAGFALLSDCATAAATLAVSAGLDLPSGAVIVWTLGAAGLAGYGLAGRRDVKMA